MIFTSIVTDWMEQATIWVENSYRLCLASKATDWVDDSDRLGRIEELTESSTATNWV